MEEKWIVGSYSFEREDMYQRAVKENTVIQSMRQRYDLKNPKIALKVYQKAMEEQAFVTILGYSFLDELRQNIVASSESADEKMPHIAVNASLATESFRGVKGAGENRGKVGKSQKEKYKLLYEAQCISNKKMKMVTIASIVLLVAFVIIDIKTQNSIFNYFTDYEAKMEEELVNKYQEWEEQLEQREKNLLQLETGSVE